ncbi:hypothetical protein N8972_00010 [Sulfurospirillum sp.]|nr:hypothetical protein [Sulfurospirillum sp.]
MRNAVITTLKALYECKEVTANKSKECNTTRITNEISTLRNDLEIDIITDRINTNNKKWYGSYRLIRSNKNLEKVKKLLEIYSKSENLKSAKNGLSVEDG